MGTSVVDGMSMNAVQFGEIGGSQQAFLCLNDRQDRFWSNMSLDQSNGVAREPLGLGLGMGMGMGVGLARMEMGMVQQQRDPTVMHYGLRPAVQEGDKRELVGWSMLGGSVGEDGSPASVVGGNIGVESMTLKNEQSSFFTTALAPPTGVSETEEKVKHETAEADTTKMAPGSDHVDQWDFENTDLQQSTGMQSTELYTQPQQQPQHQQISTDQNIESCGQQADGEEQEKFVGRGMSVEDSEGQSLDERWAAWEEEKHAKEASNKHVQNAYFYRECQRNMVANKGCIVLDGCGEFMAAEEEGKSNAFLCAACNCHRNFHHRVLCDKDGLEIDNKGREEILRENRDCIASIKNVANEVTLSVNEAISHLQQDLKTGIQADQLALPQEQAFNPASLIKCLDGLRKATKAMLLTADCLTTLQSSNLQNKGSTTPNVVKDGGNSDCSSSLLNQFRNGKHLFTSVHNGPPPLQLSDSAFNERKEKRKRTRFSTEQITKLNDFAMEVGWTLAGLAKEDIDAVCENVGIEPTTLKYWLYNTRQKSKRRHQEDEMSQSIS